MLNDRNTRVALPRSALRQDLGRVRTAWEQTEFTVPDRTRWPAALRRTRTIVAALFAVQLAAFMAWNVVEFHRFSTAWDFSAFEQGTYLIAHGNLNPFLTTFGFSLLSNHGEFELLAIGQLYRLWPSPLMLLWLQSALVTLTCWVAFDWICGIAARDHVKGGSARFAVLLAALGALILLISPWTWWTIAFDLHFEVVWTAAFAILTARDFVYGRRRAWIWALLTIAGGDVGATYLVLIGLSLIIFGRRWLKPAVGLIALAIVWAWFLGVIHYNKALDYAQFYPSIVGSTRAQVTTVGMVHAAFTHPRQVLDALWYHRANLRANVLSGGLLGVLWPPAMLVALAIPAVGALSPVAEFSAPGFQTLLVATMMPVGTIAILSALSRTPAFRSVRRLGVVVALIAANAVIWAAVWLPQLPDTWLSVSPAAASTLSRTLAQIKPDDEVIVSYGVVGRFAARKYVYEIGTGGPKLPVKADRVWFIFAPNSGVEPRPALASYEAIAELSRRANVQLVESGGGVWSFLWTPSAGTRSTAIKQTGSGMIPAWLFPGDAGAVVSSGPADAWHLRATGVAGYVMATDRWQQRSTVSEDRWTVWRGRYTTKVRLRGPSPAELQVWDDSTGQLLASKWVTTTTALTTAELSFAVAHLDIPSLYMGFGLWSAQRATNLAGDSISVRIRVRPGTKQLSVYSVAIDKR